MVRTPFMRQLRRTGEIITPQRYSRDMRPRIGIVVLSCVAFAVAAPVSPAVAAKAKPWATVNICDTAKNPNTIGIRASMPRGKDGEQLFIRFRVQYFSMQDNKWHHVTSGGDSGWVSIPKPSGKARQKGWSFQISPNSETIKLRGVATMEWRKNGEVTRRKRERTHSGHKGAAAADPPGYSAANCIVTR
jgi:hypothetical protein